MLFVHGDSFHTKKFIPVLIFSLSSSTYVCHFNLNLISLVFPFKFSYLFGQYSRIVIQQIVIRWWTPTSKNSLNLENRLKICDNPAKLGFQNAGPLQDFVGCYKEGFKRRGIAGVPRRRPWANIFSGDWYFLPEFRLTGESRKIDTCEFGVNSFDVQFNKACPESGLPARL